MPAKAGPSMAEFMTYDLRFKNFKSVFIYGFIFVILIFIDQISKYIIRRGGGFYSCNQNIAFGIPVPSFIFWAFWAIIIFWLLAMFIRKNEHSMALIFILSGAFSNTLNRFFSGCIVDFIKIPGWPYFNFADIYITFGALLFVYFIMIKKRKLAGGKNQNNVL